MHTRIKQIILSASFVPLNYLLSLSASMLIVNFSYADLPKCPLNLQFCLAEVLVTIQLIFHEVNLSCLKQC